MIEERPPGQLLNNLSALNETSLQALDEVSSTRPRLKSEEVLIGQMYEY